MRAAGEPKPTSSLRHLTWILAGVAAIEAVVIAALLVSRQSEAITGESLLPRAESRPVAAPSWPEMGALGVRAQAAGEPVRLSPLATDDVPAPAPISATSSEAELGIVVCGSVTGPDGERVDAARVRASPSGSEDEAEARETRVESGLFALVGLSPGPWRLKCEADDALPQTIEVVLDARRALEQVAFVLARAPRVPVRFLTPEGRPLNEALRDAKVGGSVQAYVTEDALPAVVDDEVKRVGYGSRAFQRDDPDPQAWDSMLVMRVPLPVYVSAVWNTRVMGSQYVAAESPGVTFTLPVDAFMSDLASVRVRVVDAQTGGPVAGALVRLGNPHTTTDADGAASFERLLPAAYQLDVHPPDSWAALPGGSLMFSGSNSKAEYGGVTVPVTLQAGQHLDLGDVTLPRTVAVRGRVVDTTGQPVAIWVKATELDPPPSSPTNTRERATETNASDGSFAMRVIPGRWAFTAADRDRASTSELLEIRAPVDNLELVVSPAVAVFVDFTRSGDRSLWQIWIKDRNDVTVESTYWDWGDPTPWTVHLAPGDYRLEIHDPDDEAGEHQPPLAAMPLQVGSSAVRLEVALP